MKHFIRWLLDKYYIYHSDLHFSQKLGLTPISLMYLYIYKISWMITQRDAVGFQAQTSSEQMNSTQLT